MADNKGSTLTQGQHIKTTNFRKKNEKKKIITKKYMSIKLQTPGKKWESLLTGLDDKLP